VFPDFNLTDRCHDSKCGGVAYAVVAVVTSKQLTSLHGTRRLAPIATGSCS